jgi:hypothetical protein
MSVRPDCSSQLLFSLQELHNLSLMLPPETVTLKKQNAQSTIDLAFYLSSLSHSLTACCSGKSLDYGSEHYPIGSTLLFSPHISLHVLKDLWRKADNVALSLSVQELDLFPRHFQSCENIDAAVDMLVKWIKEAVA